ncbi:MAG TPA: hypothetical protein VG795_02430 [Acidimicrobiia bacterium]|nr:hypothetical protein [Acidimicrobiia bacterium]
MSRRRVVIGIVVLVVAGTAVWWRQTVTSDPKLQFTLFNRVNRVEHDGTGNQEGIVTKGNGRGSRLDIAFVPGQRIFVYLGLRNEGGRTVRIEGVPPAGFYYFGFDTMEVSPERGIGIGQMTTYERFKAFTLDPGEARNVRLTFRLADCTPAAGDLRPGTTSIHGLLMRYTILGLGRTSFVPFEESVLAVPTIGQCEHPILDTQPGS